jgi:hypothetical protein
MKKVHIAIAGFFILGTCIAVSFLSLYAGILKSAENEVKIVENDLKKEIKKFKKLPAKTIKELTKLGFPTDPHKLIEALARKLPEKAFEELGIKILKILEPQFADLSKILPTILLPLEAIVSPIPPLPPLGFLIANIPEIGEFGALFVDQLCDFTIDATLGLERRKWFGYLKTFHALTNNRYINKEEENLIKSYEAYQKEKGLVGKVVNLNKLGGISLALSEAIEKAVGPLSKIIQTVEKKASCLLKPFEQLGSNFAPFPFAAFVPSAPLGGVDAPIAEIYNRMVFICNIKQIQEKLEEVHYKLTHNFNAAPKSNRIVATVEELEQSVIGKYVKLLKTMTAPVDKALNKIDEIFVDPFAKMPWGMFSVITITLAAINFCGSSIDKVIKAIIEAVIDVLTGGAGTVVSAALVNIINIDSISGFISDIVFWSYIRFLQKRIARMDELIEFARADGITLDAEKMEEGAEEIIRLESLKGQSEKEHEESDESHEGNKEPVGE